MTTAAAWLDWPEPVHVAALRAERDAAVAQIAAVRALACAAQAKTCPTTGLVSSRVLLRIVGEDQL